MDSQEFKLLRAEQAEQLKNNPVFIEAFVDARTAILESLASLPNLRKEEAHDLHRMLKCLSTVQKIIDEHIDTGKIIRKNLTKEPGFLNKRRI